MIYEFRVMSDELRMKSVIVWKFIVKMVFSLLVVWLMTSCSKKNMEEDPSVFYTCSMDPQVMEKKPGTCPICKMDLTKTVIDPNEDKESIKLSDTQIKLGNIELLKVGRNNVGNIIRLKGTIVPDERKGATVSSRVRGRIDKLFVKVKGETVNIGDPVYKIYSEELQAAVDQYLMLGEKKEQLKGSGIDYEPMIKAAKDKLIVWGLTEKQMNSSSLKNESGFLTFFSQAKGVVKEVFISEGDYVNEGSEVYQVEDLSTLWVEAEVYPQDVKVLTPGVKVDVVLDAFPEESTEGTVTFVNPELEENARFTLARIDIPNKEGKLKPGMRAVVSAKFNNKNESLTIPVEAIVHQPNMDVIWVHTGGNVFKPKMVKLGSSLNGKVEVVSGLDENEEIVISGAYLIDSEYRLRTGAGGMQGMDHGGEAGGVHQH